MGRIPPSFSLRIGASCVDPLPGNAHGSPAFPSVPQGRCRKEAALEPGEEGMRIAGRRRDRSSGGVAGVRAGGAVADLRGASGVGGLPPCASLEDALLPEAAGGVSGDGGVLRSEGSPPRRGRARAAPRGARGAPLGEPGPQGRDRDAALPDSARPVPAGGVAGGEKKRETAPPQSPPPCAGSGSSSSDGISRATSRRLRDCGSSGDAASFRGATPSTSGRRACARGRSGRPRSPTSGGGASTGSRCASARRRSGSRLRRSSPGYGSGSARSAGTGASGAVPSSESLDAGGRP